MVTMVYFVTNTFRVCILLFESVTVMVSNSLLSFPKIVLLGCFTVKLYVNYLHIFAHTEQLSFKV